MSEEKVQKQTKFEKLTEVANDTKEALIRSWRENNGCFIDKDKMKTSGILAEASGLTSLLLFLVAFNEEKGIITDSDRESIREIHRVSFSKICSWINEEGFTAEPLIPKGKTEDIFEKEDSNGYVDTITWVLSVAILTRYVDRSKILTVDIELIEKNYDLLADALGAVISSQHDDGTWGFLSDKESEKSLYFTFVANAAVADFFDYIMGEIAYLTVSEDATEEEIEAAIEAEKDQEVLRYLENKFRKSEVELVDDSIETTVDEVRRKIQDWLIYDCLPLMPELALCDEMAAAKKERLGMWNDHGASKSFSKYFNLYYIYYLIEMMVTSGSDQRIKEIVGENGENADGINKLKTYYKKNELMKKTDITYYFAKENITSFWKSIMEQSIHSSRSEYMNVSRTGDVFWDDPDKSSLKIYWNHSAHRIQDEIESIENHINNCTDPCIIPMALRSNVMYSYYISQQSDMTVDRLFENICDQRADADTEKLFGGLWDSNSFSLTVTERSVEAIVDYYDFLKKFDKLSVGGKTSTKTQKSQIDILIEEKIADYLKTPEAKSIIDAHISARLAEAGAVPESKQNSVSFADDFDAYLKTSKGEETVKNAVGINNINEMYNKIDELSNSNKTDVTSVIGILDVIIGAIALDDVLASRLSEICETMKKLMLKNKIANVYNKSDKKPNKDPEKLQEELTKDVKDLYEYIIKYCSETDGLTRKSLREIMSELY